MDQPQEGAPRLATETVCMVSQPAAGRYACAAQPKLATSQAFFWMLTSKLTPTWRLV